MTEEKTTRSIIVRGKEKDLDVVDKVIREIDVRTKQVLIEAFIVEATSTFERALGNKLGGAYTRKLCKIQTFNRAMIKNNVIFVRNINNRQTC